MDPSSDWAAEAQRRLNDLQEKMKIHEKPAAMLRKIPAVAAFVAALTPNKTRPWILGRGSRRGVPRSRNTRMVAIAGCFSRIHKTSKLKKRRSSAVGRAYCHCGRPAHISSRPWLADLLGDLPS